MIAAFLVAGCGSGEHGAEEDTPADAVSAAENEQAIAPEPTSTAQESPQPDSTEPSPSAAPAASVEPFEPYELLRSLEADFVSVNAIAFTPDGKTLVTGGGTPSIWQIGSDEPLHVLDGLYPMTGTIVEADTLAISADGSLLAMGGGDGVLHLIDLAKVEAKQTIESHEEGVLSVAFSGDGKTVASSGYDGQARLWNCETGEPILSWKVEEGRGFLLDLSPDGKTVVTAGSDALLWSAETGEKLGDLNLGDERLIQVMNVAFSPDGKQIATAEATADLENAALIWSTETRKLTGSLKHQLGVRTVAFSSDGRLLATASVDVKARIWRIDDEKLLQTIEIDSPEAFSVDTLAWMPGGEILAVVTGGTVMFWGPKGALPADESAADAPTEPPVTATQEMDVEMEAEVVGSEMATPPADAVADWTGMPADLPTPATLEEIKKALDLNTLPKIDGGDYQRTEATQVDHLAPIPLPEARDFYQKHFSEASWTEHKQTYDAFDTDQRCIRVFEKDGFFVQMILNALPAPALGQRVAVGLHHMGNVDTRKLPMPPDAKKSFESAVITSIDTAVDPYTVLDSCRNLLVNSGWSDQGVKKDSYGTKLTLDQHAVRLVVDIRESDAGTGLSYRVSVIKE